MAVTATEENYIKAIYHLQRTHSKVSTTLLSAEINTKPASVTDMLKKLEAKKLLHYQKYKGFSLTKEGAEKAINVVRKHRLWEYFLVNKLGFTWDEVHGMAEELEHISSNELTNRLDDFLGRPAFDPHGDPIPDSKGKIKSIRQQSLLEVPLRLFHTVSFVKNQRVEMLELLKHFNISIGTRIKVLQRFAFDESVEIRVERAAAVTVSKQVAQNIFCSI